MPDKCYDKKGKVIPCPPPIITNNKNDPHLRAYNDSLNLYNKEQNWIKSLNADTYNTWKVRANHLGNTQEDYSNLIIPLAQKAHQAGEDYFSYNRISNVPNKPVAKSSKLLTDVGPQSGSDYSSYRKITGAGGFDDGSLWEQTIPSYKKPVQPVVYQPQPEYPLVDKSNYQAQVRGNITSPQQIINPLPTGDPVYGPANSLIGYGNKGVFSPSYDGAPSKVNQADIDLLGNKEELNSYIQTKGYKMKMGGKIKTKKYALGTDEPIDPNDPFGLNAKFKQLSGQVGQQSGNSIGVPFANGYSPSTNTITPVIPPTNGTNYSWTNFPSNINGNPGIPVNPDNVNPPLLDPSQSAVQKLDLTDQNNKKPINWRNLEMPVTMGLTALDKYLGDRDTKKNEATNLERAIRQTVFAPTYNPYSRGNGSQAIMKDGGTIHINPKNKGKFNATKKATGKTTEELTHSSNPVTRKRAIFAQNASKWHHGENGLNLDPQDQPDTNILWGGKTEQISDSTISNPMIEFHGDTHAEGGIGIQHGTQKAEVEDGEVGWVDKEGALNIFGKLNVPGTNKKFKTVAKDIAKQELKVDNTKSKYTNILNNADPADPYSGSAFNTATVMFKSLNKQANDIAQKKQGLSDFQNTLLSMINQSQEVKQQAAYGAKIPKMPDGGKLSDPLVLQKIIDKYSGGKSPLKAADFLEMSKKYNVPVELMLAQGITESNLGTQGKAVKNKNIYNLGNSDGGTGGTDVFTDYKSGLENYAKTIKNQYTKNGKLDIQGLINSNFTRPTMGGQYASATDYGRNVAQRLNEITGGSSYISPKNKPVNEYVGGRTNMTITSPQMIDNTTGDVIPYKNESITNQNMQALNTPGPVLGANSLTVPSNNGTFGQAYPTPPINTSDVNISNTNRRRGYQSPLDAAQITPELLTLATNNRDPVTQLSYQPDLKQTFDMSYQLGRNENQSSFNQIAQIAQQTGNIDSLSELAAQKYKADETYNNSEVQNNAQQKLAVYGQNTDTLNDAKLKNLQLIDSQQEKIAQGKFNQRREMIGAVGSIADKFQKNKLENKTYNAYANLFPDYGFDTRGNVTFDRKTAIKWVNGQDQAYLASQGKDADKTINKVDKNGNETTTTINNSDLADIVQARKAMNDGATYEDVIQAMPHLKKYNLNK